MKQLYCVSPEVQGRRARVRAASPGLSAERLEAAVRYAGYASPEPGPAGLPFAAAPIRLALLHTADAGRLLCHSTCLGVDPATGRNGQFFSHVLLDVPATLDAQQAIHTWGSQLWQRADNGGGAVLPEALYLPVSSVLGDQQLTQFLRQPAQRDLFQFLLAAVLTAPPSGRIFVAAPADEVALCVYGITRALPPALLENFTFSTYEHEPLDCPARLVGTCFANPAADLPAACYEPPHVGYNAATGRRSAVATEAPFVEFAVDTLARGHSAALDEFHATWQRLGVKEAALLDLVYRMARGTGTLTREESQQVLQHPTLGAWIASRPDALRQFLDWALEDNGYATTTFSRAVAALRQRPEVLARLAQTVQEEGLAAVRAGDLVRAPNALEAVLPMVAPAKAAAVWTELLTSFPDPEALSWEMRCYLLPRLVRLQPLEPGQVPGPALERWLRVPADKLAGLLALHLPEAYQLAACSVILRQEADAAATLGRILTNHPHLALTVLRRIAAEPEGQDRALALFNVLTAEAPAWPWAEDLVRQRQDFPAAFVDRCLETVLRAGRANPVSLVRGHGSALLAVLADAPTLDLLTAQLLAQPAEHVLEDRAIGEFLTALESRQGLSVEVRERVQACQAVRDFLKQPALERDVLVRTAAALALQPPLFPQATGGRVVAAVAEELGRQGEAAPVQTELESVLSTLGPWFPEGPTALYRELLNRLQRQRGFWKQPAVLHAFLAVALGATESAELAAQLAPLDAEAFALARQTGQRGGARVLAELSARAAAWPRGARSQWQFLVRAVRPRGWQDVVRDGALYLAGFATAGVVAGVLKVIGWF